MPFEIDSITFADEFNTGTTTELNGNVSDIITATINISYTNIIDASSDASYYIYGADSDTLSLYPAPTVAGRQCFYMTNGLEVQSNLDEFQNGTTFEVQALDGTTTATFTVDYVADNTFIDLAFYKVIVCQEADSLTNTYPDSKLVITEALTDCDLQYRFHGASLSGDDSDYQHSISLGDPQEKEIIPTFKTTDSPLSAVSGTDTIPFKYDGAYQTGSMTIEGKGINSVTVGSSVATDAEQTFEIIHTLRATPIGIYQKYSTDYPTGFAGARNAINNIGNTFSLAGCRYGLKGTFSNQVAGGMQIPFNYETLEGSIAPPNSKYGNTGDTKYSISNLSMIRTSDSEPTSVPLYAEKFTISFDINETFSSPFSDGNTKVKIGIENFPDDIDNSEDYEQTFLSDYKVLTVAASPTPVSGDATGDAASITNATATYNSTSSVTVSFDVEFTSGAQTQITSYGTQWFYIYCETQNHTLDYTNSDRVVKSVYNGVGKAKILAPPVSVNTTQFITAPYSDLSQAVSNTNLDCFPVQLAVGHTRWYADWTNRDNLRIDTITQKLVLKNSSTSEEIELEGTNIPVNTLNLIDTKYPEASYAVGKGFKIPTTEVRNLITLENNFALDSGNVHYYDMQFPFFIRWEDYTQLLLSDTPSTLLDTAEPNNGVNYDLYRYDTLANWDIYYRVTFDSSEDGETFSQDFDYQLTMSDYNSHPEVTTRELKLFKEDGTTSTISGGVNYVESSEKTLVQYEWTFTSPPSATTAFSIEFFLEAFEDGSPVKIQRISSENNLLSGSWFTDTGAGDGLVAKSISGSKAIGKAYINNDTLVLYDNYRLYATIYSPNSNEDTFITEAGEPYLTETGIDNLIDE